MKVLEAPSISPPWLAFPKFKLGQLICHLYTVDDELDLERYGQTYHSIGFITGIVWNPDSWRIRPGWVYTVYWVRCNCYPSDNGKESEVQEEELVLVNLASGVKRDSH